MKKPFRLAFRKRDVHWYDRLIKFWDQSPYSHVYYAVKNTALM